VLSYYFLKLLPQKSYSECIAETMAFAGDTDTNGAIVGGMIGSCIGRQNLPITYVEKILGCGPKKGGSGIMPDEVQPARTYQ
jgi:ADP-ribosylglycohydrolase